MSAEHVETSPIEAPLARLERSLIDEYLRARGYDPLKVSGLPEHERERLLKDASLDASARLAEVEARSHFVHEIHGAVAGPRQDGLDRSGP